MSLEDDRTIRVASCIPILAYHKVADLPFPSDSAWITRDLFRRQMAALHAYGYTTVHFIDIVNFKKKKMPLPCRPVILTFDDGYECVYSLVRPILSRHGFKATCFLCTDYIGTEKRYDNSWDVGDCGKPVFMMLWKEAAIMEAEGHSCEAHTLSHPRLDRINPWKAHIEIAGAKKEIEKRLSKTVTCFAYPFGDGFKSFFLRFLVRISGYQSAVSYNTGMAYPETSDVMALPRIKITQEHSVDLNLAHPESFFMRIIDPSFPLPRISIDRIETFDSLGKRDRPFFAPGESLTVKVIAINSGDAVDVRGSLQVTGNAGKGEHMIFSSHPQRDVCKRPFACGSLQEFAYMFRIPDDAADGGCQLKFDIHDDKYVLRYFLESYEGDEAPLRIRTIPSAFEEDISADMPDTCRIHAGY
ncbi:MAG: polysaccharide deacetylase family protein [Methanothrix sp.]|nr:polysaccharide deacetylase family protein [Methanothrix sp.]